MAEMAEKEKLFFKVQTTLLLPPRGPGKGAGTLVRPTLKQTIIPRKIAASAKKKKNQADTTSLLRCEARWYLWLKEVVFRQSLAS